MRLAATAARWRPRPRRAMSSPATTESAMAQSASNTVHPRPESRKAMLPWPFSVHGETTYHPQLYPPMRSVVQDAIQELPREFALRLGEELLRRRLFDDLAAVPEHHGVGHAPREAHLVRHADHGHALAPEVLHDVQHLLDHLRIERGGRLVEEHDLRPHGERTRDGDALLLSARELAGIFVRLLGDANALEQVHGERAGLSRWHAPYANGGKRDVLQDREMREKVERLEHHADLGAHRVQRRRGIVELMAVDDDTPALMALEPAHAADERRLT